MDTIHFQGVVYPILISQIYLKINEEYLLKRFGIKLKEGKIDNLDYDSHFISYKNLDGKEEIGNDESLVEPLLRLRLQKRLFFDKNKYTDSETNFSEVIGDKYYDPETLLNKLNEKEKTKKLDDLTAIQFNEAFAKTKFVIYNFNDKFQVYKSFTLNLGLQSRIMPLAETNQFTIPVEGNIDNFTLARPLVPEEIEEFFVMPIAYNKGTFYF